MHVGPRHMYELGAQAHVLGARADEHATDTLPPHKLLSRYTCSATHLRC